MAAWKKRVRAAASQTVPPVVKPFLRGVRFGLHDPELFDGCDQIFVHALAGATKYGEYGLGMSTLHVLNSTSASVVSVESDPVWASRIQQSCNYPDRLDVRLIDVGPVGLFGTPINYEGRHRFAEYPSALWANGDQYDVVLIDGRFRVACFLSSLLNAQSGTKIVFDDYVLRPRYHLVEEFVTLDCKNERQALFVVPESFDESSVRELLNSFTMVTD